MTAIQADMHEIRRRFVQGILQKLPPPQLREFVTGWSEDEDRQPLRRTA